MTAFSPAADTDFRKGAISVAAVMMVISVAVTGLSMNISVDIVTEALSSQQHAGDLDWFENTVVADTIEHCNSDRSDLYSPPTTNYTRHIAGLESIEIEFKDHTLSTYDESWRYILDFGDDEEEFVFDAKRRLVGSLDCDDDSDAVSFGGMASGSSISLADEPHNYRIYSDAEGEAEIQIYEEED